MTAPAPPVRPLRPLFLGASGRVGRGLRHLANAGLWPPGPQPFWQVRHGGDAQRQDTLVWDILAGVAPDFGAFRGIIAFAGPTAGPVHLNTALALAAIDLALDRGGGPVLLASSSAVYGGQAGPMAEGDPCQPLSPYGKAKLAMEQAVQDRLAALGPAAPVVCVLRIGNVAGADVILQAAMRGPVTLDRFADGLGPRRSYVGPQDLAAVLTGLLALAGAGQPLPAILNVGSPEPVAMADLLAAAGLGWTWQVAPPAALARMTLDTRRLAALLPDLRLSADPADLIRQARQAGWQPA